MMPPNKRLQLTLPLIGVRPFGRAALRHSRGWGDRAHFPCSYAPRAPAGRS